MVVQLGHKLSILLGRELPIADKHPLGVPPTGSTGNAGKMR